MKILQSLGTSGGTETEGRHHGAGTGFLGTAGLAEMISGDVGS